MVFLVLLALAALCGGCIGAAISGIPGKRGRPVLRVLLLTAAAAVLFACVIYLLTHRRNPFAIIELLFPILRYKVLGCAALILLGSVLGFLLGILRAGGLRRYFSGVNSSRLHRGLGLLLLGGGVAFALLWFLTAERSAAFLRLNEVSCAQKYIEIINTGDRPIDLRGYTLSDKASQPGRFRFPSVILGPGECLVVHGDGTGISGQRTRGEIRLNFSLSPGETVYFSSPSGRALDRAPVPERIKGVSLTRQGEDWVLAKCTPGCANDGARLFVPATLEAPVLSLASGFYDEPQTLIITAAEGCQIRYTLDGSVPTADSPLYEGPLTLADICDQPNRVLSQPNTTANRTGAILKPVDKGTVVRAAAFDGDAFSEPVTAVYFVGDFSAYEGRAILNLTVDPEDLFGDAGIAVTGPAYDAWLEAGGEGRAPTPNNWHRGRAWEREAVVELWDAGGELLLDQACGVRIQGNASRDRALKRFSFYAREIYSGSSEFDAQIFSGVSSHSFSTRSDLYDFMVQRLFRDRDLGGQDVLPVTVFVNGELYKSTFLRERYDARYFQTHFDVEQEDVVLISDNELDIGTEADYEDYLALMKYIETHDCSDPAVWAEIQRQIDVQSLLDYLSVNFYFNNIDWRYTKNYKLWRSRSTDGEGFGDGRWRWLAYDMDVLNWVGKKLQEPVASIDPFHALLPWMEGDYYKQTYMDIPIFRSLLKSPEFKTRFIQTYLDLMNVNFSADYAAPMLEEYGLAEHFYWRSFLTERPPYALRNLIGAMELETEECSLTLRVSDPAGGGVRLNTVRPGLSGGSWTGTWLTGVPLTLTAEPAEGWRFVRWEGVEDGDGPAITLTPAEDMTITAVFERTDG